MSNKAQHNDDLFRHQMEDYREMPSDRVWAGVQEALNQNKKKRRFAFWLWTSGFGFAAMVLIAAFIALPVNESRNIFETDNTTPSSTTTVDESRNITKQSTTIADEKTNNVTSSSPSVETKQPIVNNSSVSQNVNDKKVSNKSNNSNINNTENRVVKNNVNGNSSNKQIGIVVLNEPLHATIETKPATVSPIGAYTVHTRYNAFDEISIAKSQKLSSTFVEEINPNNIDRRRFPATNFTLDLGVYGYTGAVAYQRKTLQSDSTNNMTGGDTDDNKNRFGLYAGTAIKAQFVYKRNLYFNVGIGYETQHFASRQQFQIPANFVGTGSTQDIYPNSFVNTSFGNVALPLVAEDAMVSAQTLEGKLVYQNHHLFVPMDIGYRLGYRRFSFNIGASAAFHIPISQSAYFYPDNGERRVINVNKTAPFNFSVGLEPSLEYRFYRNFSLVAGGTFRYHVLNAYQSNATIARPYVLSAHLGIRFRLANW